MLRKMFSLETRAWSAGFFNVLAWILQVVETSRTGTAPAIGFLLMGAYIQLTFAQIGWKEKTWGQFWGMTIGATLTLTVLVLRFM